MRPPSASAPSSRRSAARLRGGGDLGFVTRGKLSKEFDDVIFEEEPGFVYGPITTQFGSHLIYLHSCREPSGAGGLNAADPGGRIRGKFTNKGNN